MTPYDQALHDYYYLKNSQDLVLHNNYGPPETMPLEVFFRDDISDLETYALSLCHGKVLDIGAGAGAHTQRLQQQYQDVVALEISEKACEIMTDRGIENVVCDSYYNHKGRYDTVLMLMNGFGLAGNLDSIPVFLAQIKSFLKPEGKLIVDSSDVSCMFKNPPKDHYYGEVKFCYEYNHILGDWFNWLYIDQSLLLELLDKNDWNGQVIYEDDYDQFLAILKPNSYS